MAPSATALKAALIEGTLDIYKAEPDGTSVNKVRRHVEQKLSLEDGFFTTDDWKQKSKEIIKEQVDKLLEADASEPKSEDEDAKSVIKRQLPVPEAPETKRRKRKSEPVKKKEESDHDAAALSEEEAKPKTKKAAARRKTKVLDSEDEDDTKVKPSQSPSPAAGKRKRSLKNEAGSDDEMKIDSEEVDGDAVKKQESPSGDEKPKVDNNDDETKPEIVEEDEYSDVIDEPPPPKRKRGVKKESLSSSSSSKPKPSKTVPKKAAPTTTTTTPDDPQEAEIKKLQSHLSKCGVRKLWHIELKQHGDDARAKIRHLRKMLADIGMDGRFSEAKAREIKEMRELQADVEAAQEMDRLWGKSSSGRASRSKNKDVKEETKEESDMDVDGEDDGEPASFAARRRRAHADLAFLGDDSDSG